MKVIVVGAGYVGLANAAVLAERHEVLLIDIDKERVAQINSGRCPFSDSELQTRIDSLNYRGRHLQASTKWGEIELEADIVVVAVPTNYSDELGGFDTSVVDAVVTEYTRVVPNATIVIKSTVPIGYTESLARMLDTSHLVFSPEFLREGSAYSDCINCERTVVGAVSDRDAGIYKAAVTSALETLGNRHSPIITCTPAEAEAIKLFSNAFLAMRVAFFNELDTCADVKGLDPGIIIRGVCLDSRIGGHYNNPSFGYGGYCLPKDTKQLISSFGDIPQDLIEAIVKSNETRKRYIARKIERLHPSRVGVYRLVMKAGSDNCRDSSMGDVAQILRGMGIDVLIYEPTLNQQFYCGMEVMRDPERLFKECDLIVANRYSSDLQRYGGKIVTRDLLFRD